MAFLLFVQFAVTLQTVMRIHKARIAHCHTRFQDQFSGSNKPKKYQCECMWQGDIPEDGILCRSFNLYDL
jgi:hypothetical protein